MSEKQTGPVVSSAPTLLEAAKEAVEALEDCTPWLQGAHAYGHVERNQRVIGAIRSAISAAERAAPTAETRTAVRFVVEYFGKERWITWARCDSESLARREYDQMIAQLRTGIAVRIVRETSVITREVLP